MKQQLYSFLIFTLLGFCMVSCVSESKTLVAPTFVTYSTRTETKTVVPTRLNTATVLYTDIPPTATLKPTLTTSSPPGQIIFPLITLSPQDAKASLQELLRTNGNCTGKCLAGIRPDEMVIQDAINVMAQWGMVNIAENSQGRTFLTLAQNSLDEQVNVYLSVGTWTKKLVTVDRVKIRIEGNGKLIEESVWLENQDTWAGFQLRNIIESYGIPTYVGYFFATNVDPGASLIGRTISYGMDIHYEQKNMVVYIEGLAYYDGQNLSICPSRDPHNLWLEINPERPLKELETFYPVTWNALTGNDLKTFYDVFTTETNQGTCTQTTLNKIEDLQPDFR